MCENRDAAVDFVRVNRDGLWQIHKCHNAILVVKDLLPTMSPRDLVRRVLHSHCVETLLLYLAAAYNGTGKAIEFGAEVFDLRENQAMRETKCFADIIRDPAIYKHLLATVPLPVLVEYVETAPQDFWRGKVRYYIANRDLERAWDELLKAWKWLREYEDPAYHRKVSAGTKDLLGKLVLELAETVGLEVLARQPDFAAIPNRGHAEEMRRQFPDEIAYWIIRLYLHFREKKTARRKATNERKYQRYVAGLGKR